MPQITTQAVQADLEITTATVTMTEGPAFCRTEASDWAPVSIGLSVPEGAYVKTEADGYCEIQFGNLGIVRVDEKTSVHLTDISLKVANRSSEIQVIAGTLVSKVSKLKAGDRFQVRTPTAVCGVRGTKFTVRQAADGSTRVAVQEGTVALVPPSFDNISIAAISNDSSAVQLIAQVTEQVSRKSPLVQADQEVLITQEIMARREQEAQAIQAALLSAVRALPSGGDAAGTEAPASSVQPSMPAMDLESAVQAYGAGDEAVPAASLAPDSMAIFSKTANLELLPVEGESMTPDTKLIQPTPSPDKTVIPSASPSASAAPVISASLKAETSPSKTMVPAVRASTKFADVALIGAVADPQQIVAVSAKSVMYALNHSGKILWTCATDNGTNENSLPVLSGRDVYYAGGRTLCRIDKATGKILSQTALDKAGSGLFGRRPVPVGENLYLGSDQGLNVFDRNTLQSKAPIPLESGCGMTPLAVGSKMYVLAQDGTLFVVDTKTNQILSQAKTNAYQSVAAAPVLWGNSLVLVDRRGLVSCVDISSLKVLWEHKLEADKTVKVFQDPVVAQGKVFVFGAGKVYPLSLASGEAAFPPLESSTQVCFSKNLVWYGSGAGEFQGLDPVQGKLFMTYRAEEGLSAQALALGDAIGILTKDGSLQLLDPEGFTRL